jgi:hypothetical protein
MVRAWRQMKLAAMYHVSFLSLHINVVTIPEVIMLVHTIALMKHQCIASLYKADFWFSLWYFAAFYAYPRMMPQVKHKHDKLFVR